VLIASDGGGAPMVTTQVVLADAENWSDTLTPKL
jgi:hypothetical protein